MPLSPGTRLGPYELLALAGAGGMGEVYRARDTRLNRHVALKTITSRDAVSAERRQRFDREARAISSLTHPHICALYDIGHEAGIDYLVMEYVEGETLEQRLIRGPVPIDEALRYAADIADALDHAHRRGLTHRDLKPANVMLTERGATLLDFGLAKMAENPHLANDSSLTTQQTMTAEGMLLGMFRYMAPEQLEGQPVDARSDLFAFGAVLYEMLTARPAFEGQSAASVIAAILEHEPPAIPPDLAVPPILDELLRKCLAKNAVDRWQSAADVRFALQWAARATPIAERPARSIAGQERSRMRTLMWSLGVSGGVVAGIAGGWILWHHAAPATAATRLTFTVDPPDGSTFNPSGAFMAVSPNGQFVAFVATNASDNLIWIRPLDGLAPFALAGTNGASQPFWSPDSRFVAFVAGANLKKVDIVARGLPTRLCEVVAGTTGGTWIRDDTILIPRNREQGIDRVSANDGTFSAVTTVDHLKKDVAHQWPSRLPDGRHFVYSVKSDVPERTGLYIGSLDASPPERLSAAFSNAAYASGYLLFAREGTLFAQPFDPVSRRLSGTPTFLASGVIHNLATGRAAFSVSETGVLAYRLVVDTQLVWLDRSGRRLEPPLTSAGQYQNPALSPDGSRVAIQLLDPRVGTPDIWVIDVASGKQTRLTEDPSVDAFPVWNPDSIDVAFASNREGPFRVFHRPASAVSGAAPLVTSMDGVPDDWSHGQVVVEPNGAGGKTGLWIVTPGTSGPPPAVVQASTGASPGRLSPDGKWIACVSNQNIVVQSIEQPEIKRQVSSAGGREAQWRADGKELDDLSDDRHLFAVEVRTNPTFELIGPPTPLFMAPVPAAAYTIGRTRYTARADGQRFLLIAPATDRDPPLIVVSNWIPTLNR